MENVKASTNAEQQHESKVDEVENFDTFIKAMVQIVEKYGIPYEEKPHLAVGAPPEQSARIFSQKTETAEILTSYVMIIRFVRYRKLIFIKALIIIVIQTVARRLQRIVKRIVNHVILVGIIDNNHTADKIARNKYRQ